MQERYVSLDPANAASESSKLREEVYYQRIFEAEGGHPSKYLSTQFAVTGALCSYSWLRQRGFRTFPLTAAKTGAYGAIFVSALFSSWFAKALAMG